MGTYFGRRWRERVLAVSVILAMFGAVLLLGPVTESGAQSGQGGPYDTSIGDRAWQDFNRNGIQDSGEPDQPVPLITLSTGAVDLDGDGAYLFEDLDPDLDYTVTFADVPGLTRATPDVGNDNEDSDADASGVAVVDDLEPGEHDLTVDAGYWLIPPSVPCTVGEVIWNNTVDLADISQPIGLPAADVRFVTGGSTTLELPLVLPPVFSESLVITTVEAVSWDGYWTRHLTSTQTAENWRVVFRKNGVDVGATGFTGDLADGVYSAEWAGALEIGPNGITLPNGADSIVIEHSSVTLPVDDPSSVLPISLCISAEPAPGSIGDRVWYDDNGDGVQDGDEDGINGVTVRLLDADSNEVASAVTSGDGDYLFEGLSPGDYTVVVDDSTLPAGDLVQTFDLDGTLDHMSAETLDPAEESLVHDFGYQRQGSIGDRVWFDVSGEGAQDLGEAGINGVTVRLFDGDGNEVGSMVTSGDGDYLFVGLPADSYDVVIDESTLPADVVQTFDADGLASPHRSTYDLTPGEENLEQDFGYRQPLASLGDVVWHDLNSDGVQDDGEPGIPGVTVNLIVDGGAQIATVETGPDGEYEFVGLDADLDYIVEFELLGGAFTDTDAGSDDALDSDADTTTGRSPAVALDPGQHDPTVDAGVVSLVPEVDIEKATNGDDADDPIGPVIPVGSDVEWTYVITNTGDYDLANVVVTDDQGVAPVRDDSTDVGADDILSVDESWTYTATGTAVEGQYTNLGDVTGEPVVEGEPATDPFGDPVDAVEDEDLSHYLGFVPGAASIDIEKHTNGLDADSPDPAENPIPEVAEGGAVLWTYDITNTSDELWLADIVVTDDILGEICVLAGPLEPLGTAQCTAEGLATVGPYANLGSVTGTPVDSQGERATNPDGSEIPAPTDEDPSHYVGLELASIGDRVWFDTNGDGTQDESEPGEPDVDVVLWTVDEDGQPATEVGSVTTDSNGLYRFDGLDPTLEYVVQFLAGPLTTADAAADDLDSDADPTTGFSPVITLSPGEYNDTVDAGILPSAIGDTVWSDLNGDGIQDEGEPGVGDVTVNLLDSNGDVIATTTTDPDGLYLFDGLRPGDYTVEAIAPDGTAFSPQDQGDDDSVDSDVEDDGKTGNINLDPGEVDLTNDIGLIPLGSIGDVAWYDSNADGIQDGNEPGISELTVNLLDEDGNALGTETTDGDGHYLFDNLEAGTYVVEFIGPDGLVVTGQTQGDDLAVDSDPDPIDGLTAPIELAIAEDRRDIDAGLYGRNSVGNFAWSDSNRDGLQDQGEAPVAGIVLDLVMAGPNGVIDSSSDPLRIFAEREVFTDDGGHFIAGKPVPNLASDSAAQIASASVTLVSSDTSIAGNASATLVNDDVIVASVTTDGNGGYRFGELEPGSYIVCVRLDSLPAGSELTDQNVKGVVDDHLDNDVDPETGCTVPLVFSTGSSDMTIDIGIVGVAAIDPKTPVLAFTGASSMLLSMIAVAMIAVGASLFFVGRRREGSFA